MTTIVIPLHHGGGKLRDDSELRFALRSIAANFNEDSYQVAIVGRKLPAWVQNVQFIQQRSAGLKTALKMAAEAFPAGFFWYYDDCCILRRITAAEMKVTPCSRGWSKPNTTWARKLDAIRIRLEAEGRKAWDYSRPHGPYWFDKSMIDEAFRDWPGMDGKLPFESWILSKRDWPRRHSGYKQYYGAFRGAPGDHQQFLNYNNAGFTPELREWLEQRFPEPCPFERPPVVVPELPPKPPVKLQVHTLRFGQSWWLQACAPTLDEWCARHGHDLQVWTEADVDPAYPSAKFCEIDILKRFLTGDAEWMIYVDADVYVHPTAPAHPDLDKAFGFLIRQDRPSKFSRSFPKWCARHFGDTDCTARRWTYANAGVWACDRLAAKQMLAKIAPPFIECVQEQHQWNWWICQARRDGMIVSDLPPAWNAWPSENEPAAFLHLCGRKKSLKWNSLVERGLIPSPTPQLPSSEQMKTVFDFTPFQSAIDGTTAPTDVFHIQILRRALALGKPGKIAVEIGSWKGASTAAFIDAVNAGDVAHLHLFETSPKPELQKALAQCLFPERITLHRMVSWDLKNPVGSADFVYIDGNHEWAAIADTLQALAWGAEMIALHDVNEWPQGHGCWGTFTAYGILRRAIGRTHFEDMLNRPEMRTDRGFMVSAADGIDLGPLSELIEATA